MIWTLEGELYRVELMHLDMLEKLREYECSQGIDLSHPTFTDKSIPVLVHQDKMTNIVQVTQSGAQIPLLQHYNQDPRSAYDLIDRKQVSLYPMLIPLDKSGQPIDFKMRNAFELGEVITAGYLYNKKSVSYHPYSMFNPDLHLVDTIRDPTLVPQCRWVFCDGCYVAANSIALTSADQIWEYLYINRNEKVQS